MQSYEERMSMLKEAYGGGYGKLPNPTQCTEKDILCHSEMFYHSPVGLIKFGTIERENAYTITVYGFYFYDGSWVAMYGHWSDPHITWWMGAICEHDYEVHENYNTCQHSKTCKKCGHTETWGSD